VALDIVEGEVNVVGSPLTGDGELASGKGLVQGDGDAVGLVVKVNDRIPTSTDGVPLDL
jgi:hypothetical protein